MSTKTSGRHTPKNRESKDISSRKSRRDRHNESKQDKSNASDETYAKRKSEPRGSKKKYSNSDHAQEKGEHEKPHRTGPRSQKERKYENGDEKLNTHQTISKTEKEENIVKLAKIARSAERYDYMLECMMDYAKQRKCLNKEERDLLWESFRSRVKPFLKSWRVISMAHDDLHSNDIQYKATVGTFRSEIEKEVEGYCNDILSLLEDVLIPNNNENDSNDEPKEAEIFYQKLKGDAYRYLWELVVSDKDKTKSSRKYRDLAKESYVIAHKDAEKYLDSVHTLRLGLVLNYCVLLYEVVGDAKLANDVAKDAVDKAGKDLHKLGDSEKKDVLFIIDMIEENLNLWKKH